MSETSLATGNPVRRDVEIRTIGLDDVTAALRKGLDDFLSKPSHLVFLAIIYPVVGLIAAIVFSGGGLLQLVYPLASGFALVGPIAALAFYEISRRREQGLPATWYDALSAVRGRRLRSILVLGMILLGLFLAWIVAAQAIYAATLGSAQPRSVGALLDLVFSSASGIQLLIIGNITGFVFAAVVLAISVVSFPLVLDRDVDAVTAIATSLRAVAANPQIMAVWGLIVAGTLLAGSIPAFVGLAVVVPILGHATWHLYRHIVA